MGDECAMLGDEESHIENNLNVSSWYYGIHTPHNTTPVHVFTDITEAARESKKLNARFKRFASKQDACRFSETGHCESPIREFRPMLKENTDKSPHRKRANNVRSSLAEDILMGSKTFPSVPQRDLTKLRLAVEKGNMEVVEKCMQENPRYFISSYDKPVTVQPGPHYNVLHCASKTGQRHVAETIMKYLLSDIPWKKLYPNEEIHNPAHVERRKIVIDAYFNTSDKGCGETPLHFACKFGHLDFVKWLLTFTEVDITRRNKYDQTAAEVAGTRCAETEDLQRKVNLLIQESRHSVYVPVVRAIDNSTPPFLGKAVTPECLYFSHRSADSSQIMYHDLSRDDSMFSSHDGTPLSRTSRTSNLDGSLLGESKFGSPRASPLSPSLIISAYAGPMPVAEAKEFHKVWKTPPRDLSTRRRDMLQGIMRSDSDRGLERVGRDLAVQQKVAWKEYWEFLDAFVNLREEDGLAAFEKYLSDKGDIFIAGDNPTKLDQDVLRALPPGGVTQMSDRFPYICNWYHQVLTYPEDERKCWTTPVAVRKKNKSTVAGSLANGHDDSNVGIARNLLKDLSIEEPEDKCINDILVTGLSKMSVEDSNKLFQNNPIQKKDNLIGLEIKDDSTSYNDIDTPKRPKSKFKDEKLPFPITANDSTNSANRWRMTSTPNETRKRYPKSLNTDSNVNADIPRNPVRWYLSYQILRWGFIFVLVWTLYFIFMYFNFDFLSDIKKDHL